MDAQTDTRAATASVRGRACVSGGEICGVDESEALTEIHERTVDPLTRRESVPAIPMVAD